MTTQQEIDHYSGQQPEFTVVRKGRSSQNVTRVSSTSMVSLGARVIRAQQGDPGALDALIRSFQSMAVGYATSLLGDTHQAEDVAQDAFVEALRRLSSLRVPEAFPALLQALIRKHCDRLTRRRTPVVLSLEDALGVAMTAKDPMKQMQAVAMQEMVQQAVYDLPESERAVVLLFYMEDQSQQQIADRLNLPVSTVKSRLHEARVRLKRKLSTMSEENIPDKHPPREDGFRKGVVKKKYIRESGGEKVLKKKYIKESG